MIDNKRNTQVLNFISLVSHLYENPSKLALEKSFNPLMDDFLNDTDKEVLSSVLQSFNESGFQNLGLIIVKYYEKLAIEKRRLKQVH